MSNSCKICGLKPKSEWFVPGSAQEDNIVIVDKVERRYHIVEDLNRHGGKLCLLCYWDDHEFANQDSDYEIIDQVVRPIVMEIADDRNLKLKKIDKICRHEKTHPHIQYILEAKK